jgi:hypothetical protein
LQSRGRGRKGQILQGKKSKINATGMRMGLWGTNYTPYDSAFKIGMPLNI